MYTRIECEYWWMNASPSNRTTHTHSFGNASGIIGRRNARLTADGLLCMRNWMHIQIVLGFVMLVYHQLGLHCSVSVCSRTKYQMNDAETLDSRLETRNARDSHKMQITRDNTHHLSDFSSVSSKNASTFSPVLCFLWFAGTKKKIFSWGTSVTVSLVISDDHGRQDWMHFCVENAK